MTEDHGDNRRDPQRNCALGPVKAQLMTHSLSKTLLQVFGKDSSAHGIRRGPASLESGPKKQFYST